ncbi:hypothetical protein ABZ153_09790 [Streptomyces sp. NPDC006290]|uniref:DUF7224 domain-containing protein n=1 Tax=Streptomyces sp. NPDC006290 TaxID=3156745 RepID=UPI0033BE2575
MLWHTVLRSSSASWAAPVVAVFVLFLLQDSLTANTTHGYWNGATGAASYALTFVVSACAGAGAWEGSRFSRGHVTHWAPARNPLSVALPILTPIVLLGILGMGMALTVSAWSADTGLGTPHPGIVIMWLVMIGAATVAGFLAGRLMPPFIAVPLSLLATFCITAYPASIEPLWIRHLVGGAMFDCCALDQTPDWRALDSTIATALGVLLSGLVLIFYSVKVRTSLLACALLVGGLGTGVWLAHDLPAQPFVNRSSSDLVCFGEAPRVCVWPELTSRSVMIRQSAIAASLRLRDAGLVIPDTFTMAGPPSENQLLIGTGAQPTPDEVTSGVAGGFLPLAPPACALSGSYPGGQAYGSVAAWLALTAGVKPAELTNRYDPRDIAMAKDVIRQSKSTQLTWYSRNSQALRNCTSKPVLPPKTLAVGPSGAAK